MEFLLLTDGDPVLPTKQKDQSVHASLQAASSFGTVQAVAPARTQERLPKHSTKRARCAMVVLEIAARKVVVITGMDYSGQTGKATFLEGKEAIDTFSA